MFSTVVSGVFFVLYSWKVLPSFASVTYYLAADIFNNICSCITQAMICFVFWNIDNIETQVVRVSSERDKIQDPEEIEDDEEAFEKEEI